jgi:hypothetical protein
MKPEILQAFETLGLSSDSSQDDVKKRLKKLSLECHPDKNFDKSIEARTTVFEEKMKKINNARAVLNEYFRNQEGNVRVEVTDSTDEFDYLASPFKPQPQVTREFLKEVIRDISEQNFWAAKNTCVVLERSGLIIDALFSQDDKGNTLLHEAATKYHISKTNKILFYHLLGVAARNGCDLSIKNHQKQTALDLISGGIFEADEKHTLKQCAVVIAANILYYKFQHHEVQGETNTPITIDCNNVISKYKNIAQERLAKTEYDTDKGLYQAIIDFDPSNLNTLNRLIHNVKPVPISTTSLGPVGKLSNEHRQDHQRLFIEYREASQQKSNLSIVPTQIIVGDCINLPEALKDETAKQNDELKAFIGALEAYKAKRITLAKGNLDSHTTRFFKINFGYSAREKIDAVNKLTLLLKNEVPSFKKREIEALRNSDLGKIMKAYNHLLPKKFLELEQANSLFKNLFKKCL